MNQNLYADNVTHVNFCCEIDGGKKTTLSTLKTKNAQLFQNNSKIPSRTIEISQTNYLQKCHLQNQLFYCR